MCFLQLDTMVGHVDDWVQSQKLKLMKRNNGKYSIHKTSVWEMRSDLDQSLGALNHAGPMFVEDASIPWLKNFKTRFTIACDMMMRDD